MEKKEEFKPALRGRIHQGAFYLTVLLAVGYLFFCRNKKGNLGITIYIASQLILFGVSSTYHTTNWPNDQIREFFQFLDHISIFILISGTQTSVVLTILAMNKYAKRILITTWTITACGIIKILATGKLHNMFDLVFYICHGLSIVPFLSVIYNNVGITDIIFFTLGGITYIIGAIIYGYEKPNPIPKILGFHEIFHIFILLGSLAHFFAVFKYVI